MRQNISSSSPPSRIERTNRRGLFLIGLSIWLILIAVTLLSLGKTANHKNRNKATKEVYFFNVPNKQSQAVTDELQNDWNHIWKGQDRVAGLSDKEKLILKSLEPSGDTYFVRYPGIMSAFIEANPSIRRRFQLASLSSIYSQKRRILLDLAQSKSLPPMIRFRAYTGVSRAAFRGTSDLAKDDRRRFAQKALEIAVEEHGWSADADYLLALDLLEGGMLHKAEWHLSRAIKKDRYFLAARSHYVTLLADKLFSSHGWSDTKRMKLTMTLLTSLQTMVDLTQVDSDFISLAKNLSSRANCPETMFAVGYCYYHGGDTNQADNHFTQALKGIPVGNKVMSPLREKCILMLDRLHKNGD